MKVVYLIAIAFMFNACGVINCTEGSEPMVTKNFPQENFDAFNLSSSADVELIPSTKNEIEIYTYENIFENLEIENKAGEVEVDIDGCVDLDRTMKVRVYCTNLKKVVLSGSGNIVSRGMMKGENFEVSIVGSGDANIETDATNVVAEILGSGDILLRGKANNLKGKINGSGSIKASDFKANSTQISINGSGDATLGSCTNLTSSVNGSGNVNCVGK